MALNIAKFTFLFQAAGAAQTVPVGWSETLYRTQLGPNTDQNAGLAYVGIRKQILGDGAACIAMRYAQLDNPRAGIIRSLTEAEGTPTPSSPFGKYAYDPAQWDMLFAFRNPGLGYKRPFFLAGVPDYFTDQFKAKGMDAAFLNGAKMNDWIQELTAGGWCWYPKDRTAPNPKPRILMPITQVTPRMMRARKRGRPFFLFRGHV